jgi:hypothetical protein
VPCLLPRRIERVRVSITSPLIMLSPNGRRVSIRIVTFGACSGFTHVTARRIAQPPKVTFVTRLQPSQLPNQAARQLPDQSTTIRVELSSTDDSRLRGALPSADVQVGQQRHIPLDTHSLMTSPECLDVRDKIKLGLRRRLSGLTPTFGRSPDRRFLAT